MAQLRGALAQIEVDVLSASSLERYPEGGGGSIRPGYELGTLAGEFIVAISACDADTRRRLLAGELSEPADRQDRSMRVSSSTIGQLDEIAALGGLTRIGAARAVICWRKKLLDHEAANSTAPEIRATISLCSGGIKLVEAEAVAQTATEAAAAAYALLVDRILDAKTTRSISEE